MIGSCLIVQCIFFQPRFCWRMAAAKKTPVITRYCIDRPQPIAGLVQANRDLQRIGRIAHKAASNPTATEQRVSNRIYLTRWRPETSRWTVGWRAGRSTIENHNATLLRVSRRQIGRRRAVPAATRGR
jgi:hypothetical protein